MTTDLTKDEIVFILSAALERIKDAPLSQNEMQDISQDALRLIQWGFYDPSNQSEWAKTVLGVIIERRRFSMRYWD